MANPMPTWQGSVKTSAINGTGKHTSIARRWLDNDALARDELAVSFSGLHHGLRNAVLDGPARGHELDFADYQGDA